MWRAPVADGRQDDVLAQAELLVARGDGDAAVVPAVDQRQQLEQDGGLQLVEARVVADVGERLLVLGAVEAQHAAHAVDLARCRVVIRPPSPKPGRFLVGKNENVAASPIAPQRTPSSAAPNACAASSITGRPCLPDRHERRHVGRVAEQVHRHDRAGARRDRGLDGGRDRGCRSRPRCRRRPASPDRGDRLGRRVERERGADDLVAGLDAERAQRDHERVGAVGHADAVRRAGVRGEARSASATRGPRM